MSNRIVLLRNKSKTKKETTLHRRLTVLFISVSVSLIFLFTVLIFAFGINGSQKQSVKTQLNDELETISDSVESDFGRISNGGIAIAKQLITISEHFFEENDITSSQLCESPELIEPLLNKYMQTLLSTVKTRYCGGAFVILDASSNKNSQQSKAGFFLKKTQPTATEDIGVTIHYLRGPAQIARDNNLMLLGQWQMEYSISELPFWDKVIQNAEANAALDLSYLYYWTERIVLSGNSEASVFLCIPMISEDKNVFGVCGIEISDRMFKQLYTPNNEFENIFTIIAPSSDKCIYAPQGLVAGDSYLTSKYPNCIFSQTEANNDFDNYSAQNKSYSGKTSNLHLYPIGSLYENEEWTISVLMPQEVLYTAVKGNSLYFIYVVAILFVISVISSILISRHYLRPVKTTFEKIKSNSYADDESDRRYSDMTDLLKFLSQKDREYDTSLKQMHQEVSVLQNEHKITLEKLRRLSYTRKNEIDPECYRLFLNHLNTLTTTERIVFNHYLDGKSSKEIMNIMNIKESTLKYHNRNLYSKLGVTSRKELLRYVSLMQEQSENI